MSAGRETRLFRQLSRCALLAFSLVAALVPKLSAADAVDPSLLPDAELTSVQFISADRGWAVGDRGVIWHTRDGGRQWKLQPSPVPCRLECVHFIDEANGWIAGAITRPHTQLTEAVLLKTTTGGQRWTVVRTDTLPGLRGVKFFDANKGWIWGDSSGLYPSGILRTHDGGQTWTPIPKGTTSGWVAGDFRDARSGAVAGLNGELGLVAGVDVRPSRTTDVGLRYLRRLQLGTGTAGWLVGDGGLVMNTDDSGFTWKMPHGPLPTGATTHFDFRALAVQVAHCWIAGAPGTAVFHSADGGQTWQAQRTDHVAPLNAVHFYDDNRGWAVGSLGTILATRDGGKTWRKQLTGGTRAALLGIFSQPERVPWEVISSAAGNDGYLTVCEILGRQDRDGQASTHSTLPRRTQEATVAVGGSAASTSWQFPLRDGQAKQTTASILAYWNEMSDGQATKHALAHLVRRIRTWRPEVIITEDISPSGEHPLAHLTNQLVLAAVQHAADPTFAADQTTTAGLEAWKVKKVYSVQTSGRTGGVNVSPAQWAPRLGGSLGEYAQRGSGLILREYERGPAQFNLSLLVDHLPQETGRRDLFSGIILTPGGEARRQLPEIAVQNLDALSRAAQKRHNVQQLLTQADGQGPSSNSWLGQVDDLTKGLSNQSAGEVLYQLAQKYQAGGKHELAMDAWQRLVDRYPQHPLADRAAVTLLQQHTSGERAWQDRRGTKYQVQLATATTPLENQDPKPDADPKKPLPRALGPVNAALTGDTQATTAAPDAKPNERAERAIELGKLLEKRRPALFADPSVRFSLAVAHRLAGNDRQAERLLDPLTNLGEQDPWAQAVASEHWRRHASGPAPKPLLRCVTAIAPPVLDGKLDEPLWRSAKAVSLRTSTKNDETWPAAIVAAWDKEFLYVAISCAKAPGAKYEADDRPRPRDSDLTPHDHVELHLDIDRDYATHYSLAVDSRGFTADACVGDKHWNPAWYVASAGDNQYWTAEIAIPWSELMPQAPKPGDLWTAGVQRLVPGQAVQSFSHPATASVRPEGFGLWLFE